MAKKCSIISTRKLLWLTSPKLWKWLFFCIVVVALIYLLCEKYDVLWDLIAGRFPQKYQWVPQGVLTSVLAGVMTACIVYIYHVCFVRNVLRKTLLELFEIESFPEAYRRAYARLNQGKILFSKVEKELRTMIATTPIPNACLSLADKIEKCRIKVEAGLSDVDKTTSRMQEVVDCVKRLKKGRLRPLDLDVENKI